ncbi:hypothetical protein [Chitinophaga japonensis]|uniref:hypothetical protein n=1 Tax=Chitinophaga japonensis TaxID=104662 RepID=UPI00119F6062|nr:hypothetical protein [Chitinophaga japonensis]
MAFIRKYRQFTASILLAIFAFVATPVQWWHHHAHGFGLGPAACLKEKQPPVLSVKKGLGAGHDCQVCAHKYAAYHATPLPAFTSLLPALPALHACAFLTLPAPRCFSSAGRDPPPVIC